MSDRRMEESKNRWKQKAKNKAAENRELKKHLKKLTEKLNQANEELQKYKTPTGGVQATLSILVVDFLFFRYENLFFHVCICN